MKIEEKLIVGAVFFMILCVGIGFLRFPEHFRGNTLEIINTYHAETIRIQKELNARLDAQQEEFKNHTHRYHDGKAVMERDGR